jgi:hypothetical protein
MPLVIRCARSVEHRERGAQAPKNCPLLQRGKEEEVRTKIAMMVAMAAVVLVALVVGGAGTALAKPSEG